jgi:acetyl-CoA carboxylase carboxyl transferase subunit alpha
MLEHAYYSVISPEGCAGILWKSHTFKEQAAEALKMTSKDLSRLGIVDAVIDEPLGGAHRDHHLMASRLKLYLRNTLRGLAGKPLDQLLEQRYQKFRNLGIFLEGGQLHGPAPRETASPHNLNLTSHAGVHPLTRL